MGGCAGVHVPALHAQRSFHSAACPGLVSAGCSRLAFSMRSVSMVSPCLAEIPQHSHSASCRPVWAWELAQHLVVNAGL